MVTLDELVTNYFRSLIFSSRMTSLLVLVLLSLSGWVTLYVILCGINGSRGYEWNCRIVTLLHGVLMVCLTTYICFVDGPWPFVFPGSQLGKQSYHDCCVAALHFCKNTTQRYCTDN